MSGFVPIGFPQSQGRIGDRGPNGANGPAGPNGANGGPGPVALAPKDLEQSDLTNMATTPIIITADVAGFVQLPVFAVIEMNVTTVGAANPQMRIRWRGTSLDAVAPTTVALTGPTQIAYYVRFPTAQQVNQVGVGLKTPITGLGLQVDFASAPGAVFRATGRVTVALMTVAAVIP